MEKAGRTVMNKSDIGMRIRKRREALKITREELAGKIELTPRFVADIETGVKGMSLETLVRISDELGISMDYIIKGGSPGSALTADRNEIKGIIDSLFRFCDMHELRCYEDVFEYGKESSSPEEEGEEEDLNDEEG